MFKRTLIVCASVFATLVCTSGNVALDNVRRANGYYEDGLVTSQAEKDAGRIDNEKIRDALDPYVTTVNGQLVLDAEGAKDSGFTDSATLDVIQENIAFANELSSESNGMVEIDENRELVFNIEDEYMEQWQAWQLSWSWWKLQWTYKLDSDFGKLVGITGAVYNLVSLIFNGWDFFNKITRITDKNYIQATLETIFYYLPTKGVSDVISSFCRSSADIIAGALVALNIFLLTAGAGSSGKLVFILKIVDFIIKRFLPTLITSCTMIYNCFVYDAPIFCRITVIPSKIEYSMTKF